MINVAEKLQDKYEQWFEEVAERLGEGVKIDENKAFGLFWSRIEPEDAAELLKYED